MGVKCIVPFALLDLWQGGKRTIAVHQSVGKALSKCLLDLNLWSLLIILEKPDHGFLIGVTFLNRDGIRVVVTTPQLKYQLPVLTRTIWQNEEMEDVTTLGEERQADRSAITE